MTCAKSSSAGVSRPNMETLTLTFFASASMPSTIPMKPSSGPDHDLHVVAHGVIEARSSRTSMPSLSTSSSVRGMGLDDGPTKPVTPRVLRTMYHDVVGHDHFDEHIAREQLALDLALLAVLDVWHHLHGDLYLMDQAPAGAGSPRWSSRFCATLFS